MSSIGSDGRDLAVLRERLADLQLPQIAHRRRAIILFEGFAGSGKKQALRQLAAAFDPCHFTVHQIDYDRREASEGHWLSRFWRQLPGAGHTAIFYRSWYRRVLDERVLGRVDEQSIPRAFDEINEFEAQQRDAGTLIVKLLFEANAEVQARRLAERAAGGWAPADQPEHRLRADDPRVLDALNDLRDSSDTRWSPWRSIDGNDDVGAAKSALLAIAEAWDEAMPVEPPRLVGVPNRAA